MINLRITMLLLFMICLATMNLLANKDGTTQEIIDCKSWTKGARSITSGNGTVITYADQQHDAPEITDGFALPSGKSAYLRVESKLLNTDFSNGLGIVVKFKLFPRDKSKTILRTLVSKYDYGAVDRCFSLMVDNHNRLEFSISADGIKSESVVSKVNLEDDIEYTAMALYFPGKTLELYLNGAEAGSAVTAINKIFSGKSELRIGARSDKGNPAQLLNGIIYKVDFFIPAAGSGKKLKPAASIVHAAAADDTVKERIAIPFIDTDKNWEAAVSSAPVLAGIFYKSEQELTTGKAATLQPSIKAAYFPDSIGFFVHCPVKNMKGFTDNRKDNFVEICIDPNNGDQTLFAVKIQSDGNVSNAFIASCDFVQKSWDSQAHAKVKLNADSCDVFVKIPYESFGMKLSPGDVFGLAVSVNLKQNGKDELTVWPNRKTFWTWWQRRRIPDPFFFADILLASANPSGLTFVSTSRGALLAKGSPTENSFVGEFNNTTADIKSCLIEATALKNGVEETIIKRTAQIPAKSFLPVRFSYPAGYAQLQMRVVDENSKAVLYETMLKQNLDIPPRIHDIGGSYMEELVKKVKNPLAKDGFIVYPHHLKGNEGAHSNARVLAYDYDLESTVAAMPENREIPYMTVRTDTDYNNLTAKIGFLRKYGIKIAYYPTAKRISMNRTGGLLAEPYMVNVSKNLKSKQASDYRQLPCEAYKRDYFVAMEQDLSKFADVVYALILEDELDYIFIKSMTIAFATPETQKRNPFIMEINEDIKKRFGGGRYGLFNNTTPIEDVPYCKIATHRWLNDWIARFNKESVQKARTAKPDIKIISDDPQGMISPYDYRGRWHGVVDIVLHQAHDKGIPQDVGTAVICKFVKDVTGIEEFWPCVHVEGSSSIFSLDESREELSRAFRNGATGVAFWNSAWGGALGLRDDVGAPERWDYIKQIAAFYAEGNRAKLPEKADVGVFFSNYSSMADYSRGLGYVYMYLGPATGGYFKFFDDLSLERGDVSASDYKTVFVHHAEYESPDAVKKIIEAVRGKGITLVITDPLAFTKDCLGKPISELTELLGETRVLKAINTQKVVPAAIANESFAAMKAMEVGNAWSLHAGKDTVALLAYANGEPACVSRKLGKGRVIFFGFNPFFSLNTMTLDPNAPTGFDYGDKPIEDPNLAQVNQASCQFFTMLLKYLNVPLDAKIWKLKLPEPKKLTNWPTVSCLSGNSIFWSLNRPRTIANIPAHGKYRYSPTPSEKENADKDGWTTIEDGRLFDRLLALRGGRKESDSILTWNTPVPVSIEIDLGYLAMISSIDLYLSGDYPACEIFSSADGLKWQLSGGNDISGKSDGVIKKNIKLDGIETQYLRIGFKERKNQEKMIVSEIDIWGNVKQ